MFEFKWEADAGILFARVSQGLSLPDMERYERELLAQVEVARRATGRLRLLVDSAAIGPLTPEQEHRVRRFDTRIGCRDGDRVAIVVGSALCKAQMKKLCQSCRTESFMSLNAARTWLQAYDTPRSVFAEAVR